MNARLVALATAAMLLLASDSEAQSGRSARPEPRYDAALAAFTRQLAFRWAPIHVQDVDTTGEDGLGGKADYLAAIDFDGDWITANNWERARSAPLRAHVYYSVVTTGTHWFIVYAFYHPRDWSDNPLEFIRRRDTHENDLEGALFVVRRPSGFAPDSFGTLEAVVTVFHLNFYSYIPASEGCPALPASPYESGRESIDGYLRCANHEGTWRIVTAQEARGHGLKAWPYIRIEGSDGVTYYPDASRAEAPEGIDDQYVRYRLVDIFEPGGLWSRRNDPEVFASYGDFRGDDGVDNAANAPWRWNDFNDGPRLVGGELATNPARLVQLYFSRTGAVSTSYIDNPFTGVHAEDPAYREWLDRR